MTAARFLAVGAIIGAAGAGVGLIGGEDLNRVATLANTVRGGWS